jgi:hypothetical protein
MANQIADGYILVTERTFQRMQMPEVDQLAFELEKRLREIRSEQPDLDDQSALQNRNRRIMRLNSAAQMLQFHRQRRKR